MRKSTLFLRPLVLALISLNSCKKEVSSGQISNLDITAKVNTWLDNRKPGKKPGHTANIKMLKSKLEFSEMRIEESSKQERIIVVPINEKFKAEKNIDPIAVLNLVLILDASGEIRKGNIVLYFPDDKTIRRVPDNTFYAILNTARPNCDGKFRYLSVAGKTLHEIEYKDGKLKLFRKIKEITNNTNRTATFCVDWYWVYTEYDEWGYIVDQYEEYVGTTCQDENCYDPYLAMLCPMDGSSGGGLGDDSEEYEEEKVKVAVYEWTVQDIPSAFGGGLVREASRLVGKFYKKNAQNNKFLGLAGSNLMLLYNSWGQNGTVGWSNTISTGIVNSYTQMTLNSSGRITFPNTIFRDYSGSKVVNMSDCYWPL